MVKKLDNKITEIRKYANTYLQSEHQINTTQRESCIYKITKRILFPDYYLYK